MLYPPSHPEFGSALALAFDACGELLATHPVCTLGCDPTGLQLMGKRCPPDPSFGRFSARLRERGVSAVTFREGMTKAELGELIGLLRAGPEVLAERGGAAAWLLEGGVQGIYLDRPRGEPSYRAEWEAFLAVQEAPDRGSLERLLSLCPEGCRGELRGAVGADGSAMLGWLAEALGATAVGLTDRSAEKAEWLERVALAIGGLTTGLQARLFRVRDMSGDEVLREAASRLSSEEVANILVSHPNAVVGETSEQLGVVLPRLMPTEERAREVEPVAKALLVARGMTEESYQNTISVMLRRDIGQTGGSPAQQLQMEGPRRVAVFADLLAGVSGRAVEEHRVDVLLELVVSAEEEGTRQRLLRALTELLPASLAERADGSVVELLGRVEELLGAGVLTPDEKRSLRGCLIRGCVAEVSARIALYLVREGGSESALLLWLLSWGEKGFDALVRVAREAEHPGLQAAAGQAIVRMGESSAEPCRLRLVQGAPEDAVKLARALVLSGAREGLERSLWALQHPEPSAAAGLMEVLAEAPDGRAEEALLAGLRDERPEVQVAAARALGRRRCAGAVEAFAALLGSRISLRRTEVGRAVVAALGAIGNSECAAALHSLLGRRSLIFPGRLRELQALAREMLKAFPRAEADVSADPEGDER